MLTVITVSNKLNSVIIHIGKYDASPIGITVRSNIRAMPLNIPSGYVAKLVIKLHPASASISDLPNQKLKLPSITATSVNIIPPVIEKSVNKKNFVIVNPLITSII